MFNSNERLCFPKKQEEIDTSQMYYVSANEVFSNIEGNNKYNNRGVKTGERDGTVKKFMKTMLDGLWRFLLTVITLIIGPDGKLTVANGWHRLMAIKLAQKVDPTFNPQFYVRFVRARGEEEIREIIDIENGKDAREWNLEDYCTMWAENDHPTFCMLRNMCETPEYARLRKKQKDNGKPCWGKAAMLFGISQNDWKKAYKDGKWYPSQEDIEAAPERYYQVVQLINAFGNDPSNDAWLYVAQDWVDLTRNDTEFKWEFEHLPGGIESICKAIKTFPFEDKQAMNKNKVYRQRFWNALYKAKGWYKSSIKAY